MTLPRCGGLKCGAFMLPMFRDPHPTCVRCRGVKCTSAVTCYVRIGLWRSGRIFCKKRSYSGRRTSRPSGAAIPTVLLPLSPSAAASSEAGRPLPPPRPPTLPSERHDRTEKSEGFSRVGSCGVSSLPSHRSLGGGGGVATGVLASGANVTQLLLPIWGWGSGALSLSGFICARSLCLSRGRLLCLS